MFDVSTLLIVSTVSSLGLDALHALTARRRYLLRVDLWAWDGDWALATYDNFTIGPASDNYRLDFGKVFNTRRDHMAGSTSCIDFINTLDILRLIEKKNAIAEFYSQKYKYKIQITNIPINKQKQNKQKSI